MDYVWMHFTLPLRTYSLCRRGMGTSVRKGRNPPDMDSDNDGLALQPTTPWGLL